MRVAFVMEQHIGHQTYYQNLRRGVEQDGHIAATWAPITYEGASKLLAKIPGLPGGIRGTLQGMLQARRALAKPDYDVAFFNTQVPAALAGGRIKKRPYVLATDITPQQYDSMSHLYGHKVDSSDLLAAYKYRANVALFRGAAKIVPWSNWTKHSLIKDYGVKPEQIEVVPPGVDLQLWQPGVRAEGGPMRVLFVGGDFHRKGGATLLEAFRTLPQGLAELHIVTRTRLPSEPGVHTYYSMRPNSPELIALYQSADVFALPTEAEAFGIAAIEASASGLAIVATAVGGLGDVVSEGETGFLVPPRDVQALAKQLQILASQPALRQQMGRAGRQRAERNFDAQRNAARVIAHLRAAVGQSA